MKKVAGIIAVAVFTLGLFATQLADNSILTDFENAIACGDCEYGENDDRGDRKNA